MKPWLPILLVVGCGGSGPALGELSLSARAVPRGRELFGTTLATAEPGALETAVLHLRASTVDERQELRTAVMVTGLPADAASTTVGFGIRISGPVELGEWEVEAELEDCEGRLSNPVRDRFTLLP